MKLSMHIAAIGMASALGLPVMASASAPSGSAKQNSMTSAARQDLDKIAIDGTAQQKTASNATGVDALSDNAVCVTDKCVRRTGKQPGDYAKSSVALYSNSSRANTWGRFWSFW